MVVGGMLSEGNGMLKEHSDNYLKASGCLILQCLYNIIRRFEGFLAILLFENGSEKCKTLTL